MFSRFRRAITPRLEESGRRRASVPASRARGIRIGILTTPRHEESGRREGERPREPRTSHPDRHLDNPWREESGRREGERPREPRTSHPNRHIDNPSARRIRSEGGRASPRAAHEKPGATKIGGKAGRLALSRGTFRLGMDGKVIGRMADASCEGLALGATRWPRARLAGTLALPTTGCVGHGVGRMAKYADGMPINCSH